MQRHEIRIAGLQIRDLVQVVVFGAAHTAGQMIARKVAFTCPCGVNSKSVSVATPRRTRTPHDDWA